MATEALPCTKALGKGTEGTVQAKYMFLQLKKQSHPFSSQQKVP